MSVSIYIDESGTHGDAHHAVVGAAFARDDVWLSWVDDWNAAKVMK